MADLSPEVRAWGSALKVGCWGAVFFFFIGGPLASIAAAIIGGIIGYAITYTIRRL